MKIKFDKIIRNVNEMKLIDRTNPYNVAALTVHALCNYQKDNTDNFYEMLSYLMGDAQPISMMMKQNIKDRMLQNEKYAFIGKSYFQGALPSNDYEPSLPLEIDVSDNIYSDSEEKYKRLFLKSGGADSLRPITLRLGKDGNYYLWSDTLMGLLTDIRPMESKNFWA